MGIKDTTGQPQTRSSEELHISDASDAAGMLDHLARNSVDSLTRLAARVIAAPIAVADIVDGECVWFAAQQDIDLSDVPRRPDLCEIFQHDGMRVLHNVRRHSAAKCHPLVSGPPWVRFYAGVPLRLRDGASIGRLCVFDTRPRRPSQQQLNALSDIAELIVGHLELRRAARDALAQKEDLIKEINHRVSNSLQVVSNLLTLQARGAGQVARRYLGAAAGRVSAVAYIHRRLYQVDRGGMIDFKLYLNELCEDIRRSVTADEWRHDFVVEADSAEISTQRATALGLILNELVTNAIKHGYPAGVPGRIVIGFRATEGQHMLTVADDGRGLPVSVDPQHSKGLGMRIIQALTKQLAGTLAFRSGNDGRGTIVVIRCPMERSVAAD
jgi:two-component sensor histidine kinase